MNLSVGQRARSLHTFNGDALCDFLEQNLQTQLLPFNGVNPRSVVLSSSNWSIVVFAKAFTPATQNQNSKTQSLMPAGVLPASKAKLSSSYILQLRELQQLRELGWEY